MTNKVRHLITNADERTWKFDRPVVFLGEWCKSYDKKHIWQQMDSETLCPLGHGQAEKDRLYTNARALEEQIFPVLVAELNQYHKLDYSERAWRILVGPWLRRNVDVLFNRLNTLEKCMQTYTLSGMTAIKTGIGLAPADGLAALACYGRDDWNVAIFARIIQLLDATCCPIEWLADKEATQVSAKVALPTRSTVKKVLRWMVGKAGNLTRLLARESDAFFIHTYLPPFQQAKLQLAMGQFPQFWIIPQLSLINKVEPELRQKLAKKCADTIGVGQVAIITRLVLETLPSCYLEEFSTLKKTVESLPFPAKPRFIFTSNNFEANEVFQLWVALKIQSGSQYYVGQHGNNYGTYRYMRYTVEEETSDRFLTWGWKAGLLQHTPAFNFKMSGNNKKLRHNPEGGLLLVEDILGHRIYVWDRPYDFEQYLKEQMFFARQLNEKIKKQLTVRLHYTHSSFNACERLRWHDLDSEITVEGGVTPYQQLLESNRLVVYGYDSTGILESLALNLPTLVLMENSFEFIHDDALPYYQALLDAGIVHISAKTAAEKVNAIWDQVDEWWDSDKVQAARRLFCNRYSKVSNMPIKDLVTVLQ